MCERERENGRERGGEWTESQREREWDREIKCGGMRGRERERERE